MISLWTLVRAAIVRLRLRFLGLAAILLVSAATVTFGVSLGSYSNAQAESSIDSGDALRTITLFRGAAILDDAALSSVGELEGVRSVEPVLSVVVGLEYSGSVITLFSYNAASAPPLIAGDPIQELSAGEILLPSVADAVDLEPLLGKDAALTVTTALTSDSGTTSTENLAVVGLFDPEFAVDAPIAAFATHDYVVRLAALRQGVTPEQFLQNVGYDRITVVMQETSDVAAMTANLQLEGYQAVSTLEQLDDIPGVVSLIRFVTVVVLIALGLLSFVATLASSSAIAAQRRHEVAILKTYGWAAHRIRALLVCEVAIVAAAAIVSGVAIGVLASAVAGNSLRQSISAGQLGGLEILTPQLIAGSVLGFMVVLIAANAAISKAVREPVVDALRSVK